jgi:4'-phosphopantetheinyl transferase
MTPATPDRFGETTVHRLALDGPEAGGRADESILSGSERARAAALRGEPLRRRYVASHAALRRLLAAIVGGSPEALRLAAGPNGKPVLPGGPHFSLSHAGDVGLVAIDPVREVGVDVEPVRPVPEADEIAARWFAPEERSALRAAGADGGAAFARIWTRREAWLKALGVGLDEKLAGLPVDLARFALHDLVPAPGHLGALAVEQAAGGDRP